MLEGVASSSLEVDRFGIDDALRASIHQWWQTPPRLEWAADAVLTHLRKLPVEHRMEAMGMRPTEYFCNIVWVEADRG